jgi:hypothetical protein
MRPLGDNYLFLFPITKSDGNECYAFLTNRFVTAIDCTDSDLLNNEPALSTRIDEAVKEVAHFHKPRERATSHESEEIVCRRAPIG